MVCSNCGAENPVGQKFCGECGAALTSICPSCGTPNPPGQKFCGECGAALTARPVEASSGAVAEPAAHTEQPSPTAERRLVTVLFADLVGFTTLSEAQDAEEVRDILSRYFETCRTLITRYGGTVEKFIGDAVMAVWGAPVAQEDDAERAVRAALDLSAGVAALGADIGAPELRARGGVLTGEAAVNIGATNEGMVAGDLVNTASRIQSAAGPGEVYVGEATRRATEAAVVYEDAGVHVLKGKSEPVHLWRAMRVVAGVGGAQKSMRLEAPFVGRDHELRRVKELLHQTMDEGRAHLVSVVGIAGIGKSRLAWELNKYIDGLQQSIRWHRGRCLSYGEGVTYWALAEMVRTRAGILEGESSDIAHEKLRSRVAETLTDPDERRWAEPRLAQLLGLEERAATDRDDLFAAWRLFYERLADEMPTIMLFEDVQWADASLLDFIDSLMEWSRNHALFVVTLARPELLDRRPTWGAGKRNFTSLVLEPLSEAAMRDMLSGLVPGLPHPAQQAILDRAEGVPLYAMETVRMLFDQGLLAEEAGAYRPTGPIESLAVPETLHALIAARLDALTPDERVVVQDVSVLGKTFTRQAAEAVASIAPDAVDTVLASLVRKEIVSIQADRFSPERGQYGFLQDLVRKVAYETLSKRDRKVRHLAVAAYLEEAWGSEEEEIVEVVASHFVNAYEASPGADDAGAIKAKARDMLARAGDRAASLSANAEAERYYEQAADLADEVTQRALLLERAGTMAWNRGDAERAAGHFGRAIEMFEAQGESHPAARVSARLGEVEWRQGRLDQALERMERAFAILSDDEPDDDLASLAAQLGRLHFFAGHLDLAAERIEVAEEIAQSLWLPEVLGDALVTKGIVVSTRGWWVEAIALIKHALEIALEHDLPRVALRAYVNLCDTYGRRDRYEEASVLFEQGVALARRVGNRFMERNLTSESMFPLTWQGRWDEVLERAPSGRSDLEAVELSLLMSIGEIWSAQGQTELIATLEGPGERLRASSDVQDHSTGANLLAIVAEANGDFQAALSLATEARSFASGMGPDGQDLKQAAVRAIESALALGDLDTARSLLGTIDALRPGELAPYLDAQRARLWARVSIAEGADGADAGFRRATGLFRELGTPFWLAVTLIEHAEWLASAGRDTEARPRLDEARTIFERLQAKPWLDRVDAADQSRERATA